MRLRAVSIVTSALVMAPAMAIAQSTADISFGTSEQTIRGFGGAESWMPQFTTAQADALFGTGSGQLGLSILRVRIDPSSTTGGSNWATELANAQMAHALGATIIATPWTPPAAWKSSNSTVEGTLNTSEYGAYANYLNAFTAYLASGGVPLYAISMQNEPDANVTYESCVWTGATMDTWVAQNASVLMTKLIMPESESFTTSYSDPALDDANAAGKIAIIGGHIYGVSPSYYTNAEQKGKEVWMTEHYLTPSGSEPAIGDALAVAEEIHASMVTAQYNAYVWWWLWDWNPGTGTISYGLIDTNSNPTYYGYALAQFSKFIRPGSVRVSATANPVSGVDVSAYTGSGQSEIVAINSNGSSTPVTFDTAGASIGSFTPYETSVSGGLLQQSAVSVSGGAFTYTLPAQSITTFVSSGSSSGSPSFTLSPSAPTLSVTQGSNATDTISVTDLAGFSGTITLAASGLPSGVTAALSTNPTTGSSILTFTASSTATAGTSTVTITGTSGSTTASTTIALTVNSKAAAGFTLTASPSNLSVGQGSSGVDTITVTDTGGFMGSVSFVATGLPSGVTASFSPSTTTSSAVLTLTASSTAAVGSSMVTITGTSGSTTASATIALTVSAAGGGSTCTVDYTISPQNASQFGATITIKNGRSTTLSNWSLTWSFANGQTIAQSWNGAVSQSGANVTVIEQAGETWENIPAGESYSGFGFNGTWNGVTNAIPTTFSLNGTACTVN